MSESHSKWGASGFEAMRLCPGKRVLEHGMPNTDSKYSATGTAAHQVFTWALEESRPAAAYVGRVITAGKFTVEVDQEMAAYLQTSIDYVLDVAGQNGTILVDRRVHYGEYLGVPDAEAWGTLDVAVLLPDEIVSIDLKFGQGVEVGAGSDGKPNDQLALYALGALAAFGEFGDFKRVRMAITQPRITSKPSEFDMSVEDLVAWGRSTARSAVATAINAEQYALGFTPEAEATYLNPNAKSCRFCRAKATCPALRNEAVETVFGRSATARAADPDEFSIVETVVAPKALDAKWLAACLAKVDMIEDWCKAVRAEVERRLLASEPVPGFKLVQGKQGNRSWGSAAEAEAMLKAFRLKQEQMYDFSLISPTSAAKLAPKYKKVTDKATGEVTEVLDKAAPPTPIGDRQWRKLQKIITRKPGGYHVAPAIDPRPAVTPSPAADDFNVESEFA